ncbi:MAG: CBS domain-containing protein, partial [Nitrospiraceae bacterium]
MISEESINFLKSIPPFQFLNDALLESIGKNLSMEFFPRNAFIMTKGGPPSDSLRIIKKGGVRVYISNGDEITIDYKSEGDSFGFLSLVSGDKARSNIIALEDTLCYAIPKSIVMEIISTKPDFGEFFMKSFFKNYLDKTYREMHDRNLLFKEGEKLFYTTPVRNLISKSVVTATGEMTIQEAARIMSEQGISSLIITDKGGSPVGIVTDSDLREKVVAQGAELSTAVETIMSRELVTVHMGKTCFDALSTMIRHNIHHLVVTDNKGLKGVVTNHDF